MLVGSLTLPTGAEVSWQQGLGTQGLLETDWSGLAPIFIDVGTEDMFRDEDITLVGELVRQGNLVEFHLYPGAFHASEVLAPEASLSKRIMANRLDAVKRAVAAG